MNINKGYIVVAAVTAFFSWLAFSPDDAPPQRGEVESDQDSELRALPREPESVPGHQRHGIVRAPAAPEAASGGAYPYSYGRPQARDPSFGPYQPGIDPLERFSFRPLTDRERERLEAERPMPGYYPESMAPSGPSRTYSRTPNGSERYEQAPNWSAYPQAPTAPQWYGDGYSFRSDGRPSSRRERWDDPGRERRRTGPPATPSDAPWFEPSAPQWGSTPPDWTPPAERMYPSLDLYSNRKLTFR